jgi:hypothetical protein
MLTRNLSHGTRMPEAKLPLPKFESEEEEPGRQTGRLNLRPAGLVSDRPGVAGKSVAVEHPVRAAHQRVD